jgi:hypothetical protein
VRRRCDRRRSGRGHAGSHPCNSPQGDWKCRVPNGGVPEFSGESAGKARMHTCLDQYNANKATNANGGLKWIQKGGGYYSECNKQLKG